MKIEIYPEECCELCNEIVHNHFDCQAQPTGFKLKDLKRIGGVR